MALVRGNATSGTSVAIADDRGQRLLFPEVRPHSCGTLHAAPAGAGSSPATARRVPHAVPAESRLGEAGSCDSLHPRLPRPSP